MKKILCLALLYSLCTPLICYPASNNKTVDAAKPSDNVQRGSVSAKGPFGFAMGMKLDELKKITTLTPAEAPHVYKVTSVPQGVMDIEEYTLTVTPDQGLCRIRAFSKVIMTDAYGEDLLNVYNRLKDGLTHKYGEGAEEDYLKEDSSLDEEKDWMMSLYNNERVLRAYWDLSETTPNGINIITETATSAYPDSGFIYLTYDLSNYDQCYEVLRAAASGGL